jgi:hypothetical protein
VSNVFEVWLDEERQIIRQRIHGNPSLAQYMDLVGATAACAKRLRQPENVRILVEGVEIERMRRHVRAAAIDVLRKPDLKRMAVVSSSAVVRIMLRFMSVVTGLDKIRTFADETTAVAWLVS